MMQVRLFQENKTDSALWDSFVERCDTSTSDHLWGWRKVLASAFHFRDQYYLGAMEGETLKGILPLYRIPLGWGKRGLTSIPYGNYGGICAETPEAAEALYEKAKEILVETKSDYLELRHRRRLTVETLQNPEHTHSRFFINLTEGPEALFKHIGQNNRSKVRRATKWGLNTFFSDDVRQMYPLYVHTARRQGTPCFPRRYFQEIMTQFRGHAKIFMAALENQPVAYYLILYFKKSMVCQFSSSLSEYFKYYPNEYLYWRAIEEGCRQGYEELDFCRSRVNSGTAEFKRKLRYQEEPLDYQYYLPNGALLPARSPSNGKYRLAIQAWQRLPLPVANFLGPKLVRYFA